MQKNSQKLTRPALCQDPECSCANELIPAGAYVYQIKGRWICDGCFEEHTYAEQEYAANRLDMEGR